jgi:cysteine desulfurase
MTREDFPLNGNVPAGTPDIPGALATAEALRLYLKEKSSLLEEQRLLAREGWDILKGGRFDAVMLSPEDAAAGVLCIALPGLAGGKKSMEDLFYLLNLRGICLSRFSACSASVSGPSPVLEAMGFPPELCESSLRKSLGRESRREHFFRLRKALDEFFGP